VLFETEHGPTGEVGLRANDEVNIIEAGLNYGWPQTVGRLSCRNIATQSFSIPTKIRRRCDLLRGRDDPFVDRRVLLHVLGGGTSSASY
jgi:hypothetical protein